MGDEPGGWLADADVPGAVLTLACAAGGVLGATALWWALGLLT